MSTTTKTYNQKCDACDGHGERCNLAGTVQKCKVCDGRGFVSVAEITRHDMPIFVQPDPYTRGGCPNAGHPCYCTGVCRPNGLQSWPYRRYDV